MTNAKAVTTKVVFLANLVLVTPREGQKNPVTLMENVPAKDISMEKNVIK